MILSFLASIFLSIELLDTFSIFKLNLTFSFAEVFLLNLGAITLIYYLHGYKTFFRTVGVTAIIGRSRLIVIILFIFFLSLIYQLKFNNTLDTLRLFFTSFVTIYFAYVISRSSIYGFLSKSLNYSLPIIIYGAGQAGRETAAYLAQNDKYNILGFIDDDRKLKNFEILNYKVLGGLNKISKLKKNHTNLQVVMAMINIDPRERRKIISLLETFEVHVKTIPQNYGALETRLSIQDIEVEDVLDRDKNIPDKKLLEKNIYKKNILVTGAGGSIGSEISMQVANLNPDKLILLDSSEFNLYKLKMHFETYKNFNDMVFVLANIQDEERLNGIFKKHKVNTIYHAAAYKHVPLLESDENISAAINNNFISTFSLCKLAKVYSVNNFVLISSDKAVNPTNLMGASKRLSEISLQAFQDSENNFTTYSIVRFGNVLNSSGSVMPLFKEQIEKGGPVTVTHREVNRFFMTISEAANLVIQAGAISEGGEVFLLDMGDPIKILDFAKKMIRLSGNSVAKEGSDNGIEIVFSGLRPGEKLFEELLIDNNPEDTVHPKIKKGKEKKYGFLEIEKLVIDLLDLLDNEKVGDIKDKISLFVDGYNSNL
jgi:FlaA1/EpsC-like NDP-sugar epimerase